MNIERDKKATNLLNLSFGPILPALGSSKPIEFPKMTRQRKKKKKVSESIEDRSRSNTDLSSIEDDESMDDEQIIQGEKHSTPTVSTSNRYNDLSVDTLGPEVDPRRPKTNVRSRDSRTSLPPFVVHNQKLEKIYQLLSSVTSDKKQVNMRLNSDSCTIYLYNVDHYKKLRTLCDEAKIYYACHPLEDEKVNKYVLYGLHDETNLDEIKESLSEYNLTALAISKMKLKPRYDGHANFLLTFKETDNVTVEKLSQVRAIGYLRVRFDKFHRDGNPSQCPKCLKWSHGSSFCGFPPRYVRCGGQHASSDCPERKDKNNPQSTIPDDKVRCANCGGNHTGNFKGCPALIKYKKLRSTYKQRDIKKPVQNIPVYNTPAYQRHQTPNHQNQRYHQPQSNTTNVKTYASIVASESVSNDLLTPVQMVDLIQQVHQEIKNCSTRAEQIMTILRIAVELLSNESP